MTQHDFNIPNQTFPSFRQDLNSALESLATMSSGSSEPESPLAFQLWADPVSNVIKQRNATNTNWSTIAVLSDNGWRRIQSGNPNNNLTPAYEGEICFDKSNELLYYSSNTNDDSWLAVPNLQIMQGFLSLGRIEYYNTHSIRIQPTFCQSEDNTSLIQVQTPNTVVSINTVGLNALDQGTKEVSTFYYLYAVKNDSEAGYILSTVNELSSGSISDQNFVYTHKRQLPFAVQTDTTGNLQMFFFDKNQLTVHLLREQTMILNANNTNYDKLDLTPYIPDISRKVSIHATIRNSIGEGTADFRFHPLREMTRLLRTNQTFDTNIITAITQDDQSIEYKVNSSSTVMTLELLNYTITAL